MNEPTPEEARKKAEQEKLCREKMKALDYDPDNPAELAKFQELEAKFAAGRIKQQDVFREMETFRIEQSDKERGAAKQQVQPAEEQELDLPPEKNQADWRRMISEPDYRREVEHQEREVKEPQRQQTQETPQQARPAGDQPEKKAEEKDVDWRRTLTDPDYRQQVREQERAEKMERSGEHRQEQEQPRQLTQETPQPTRPIGDQPEKKASEEEVDWRRALTDPDYSREIRAQERAEQQERAGERRQEEGLQRLASGHEL
jgi:hypothetical protein